MNDVTKNRIRSRDPYHFANLVGRNVRQVRRSRGMSGKQLSELLKELGHPMSQTAISMLERGHSLPTHGGLFTGSKDSRIVVSIDRIMYLADALGVSYLRLLTEGLCDD